MFHGAAWSPSINCALATALPVGLDVRFSVSRFWDRVRHFSATQLFTMSPMHDWIYEAPRYLVTATIRHAYGVRCRCLRNA